MPHDGLGEWNSLYEAAAPAPCTPPSNMSVPISHSSSSSAPEAISGEASSEAKRTVPSTARVAK